MLAAQPLSASTKPSVQPTIALEIFCIQKDTILPVKTVQSGRLLILSTAGAKLLLASRKPRYARSVLAVFSVLLLNGRVLRLRRNSRWRRSPKPALEPAR